MAKSPPLAPGRLVLACLAAAVLVGILGSNSTGAVALFDTLIGNDDSAADLARQQDIAFLGEVAHQRIIAKDQLLLDLIEGETTLAATTDAFLCLNRCNPRVCSLIRENFPGRTNRESTARNIAYSASIRVDRLPCSRDVNERIDCELEELIVAEGN